MKKGRQPNECMQENIKITDLHFDEHNANLGTDRGRKLLAQSLEKYGAGRSIVVDRNLQAIAGNKTLQAAIDLGLDITTVKTSGDRLLVLIREDLDLETDEKARLLAYADNRTSEVGLQWDTELLQVDLDSGLDLSGLWNEAELTLLQALDPNFVLPEPEPKEKKERKPKEISCQCPECGAEFVKVI